MLLSVAPFTMRISSVPTATPVKAAINAHFTHHPNPNATDNQYAKNKR